MTILSPEQIEWAKLHEEFAEDNGDGTIDVCDPEGVMKQDKMTFKWIWSFKSLKKFFGYSSKWDIKKQMEFLKNRKEKEE